MKSKNVTSIEIEDILPLTPMQEAMLFHYITNDSGDLYLEQICLNILGPLDPEILAEAWNRVIEAHPALRTVFRWKKVKHPVQVVMKRFRLQLGRDDFSGYDPRRRMEELESLKARIRKIPMDLATEPLRVHLARMAERNHWLVVTYHHIVMDGWSNGIVLNQLLECARRYSAVGEFPSLRATPFKAYVQWLSHQDHHGQRDYWARYLAGLPEPAPVPSLGRGEGTGRLSQILNESLVSEMTGVARDHLVTPAAIINGAWAVWLALYSDAPEVVFGVTVSGRPASLPGVGDMVGLLINTLPLRVTLTDSMMVCDLWAAIFKDLEDRETNLWVSPVELKEGIRSDQEEWFDSVVVIENYPLRIEAAAEGELRVADYSFHERTHYPLTLLVSLGERIVVDFLYRRSHFSDELARTALDVLARILCAMCAGPDRPLRDLELLDDRQKEALVWSVNDTAMEIPAEGTFLELLERATGEYPDKTAVVGWRADELETLSYERLRARASRLAARLRAKGCGTGTIVALMMGRTPDLVTAMIATLWCGAAYLPIEADLPRQRLDFILADSDARYLLTDGPAPLEFLERHSGISVMVMDELEPIEGVDNQELPAPVSGRDAAYVIYTSGTTGVPKGVVIGHRALANFLLGMGAALPIDGSDILLSLTTMTFDIFVLEALLPLSVGAAVCIGTRREQMEPGAVASAMTTLGVTVLQTTPSRLQAFLENQAFRRALGAVTCLLVGGEAFPRQLERDLPELVTNGRVFNMYGPTETTVWSTIKEIGGEEAGTIGIPIANTGTFVLGREMTLRPMGIPGELYLGGLGLADGYLNRQEATGEAFVELDPNQFGLAGFHRYLLDDNGKLRLYKTGDLALREADGSLSILGRIDQQVKIRGFRIEPGEIEQALIRHPDVREAVVLPVTGGDGSLDLRAYLVADDGERLEAWREYLEKQLPAYMIPSGFVRVDRIPLTVNGKLDRRALLAMTVPERDNIAPEPAIATAKSDRESLVMDIWRQVLGLDSIPLDRPFFELGGNSLLMIRVHSRLQEAVNREFPMAVLFRYPTVRRLAAYLRQDVEEKPDRNEDGMASTAGPVAIVGMACRFPGAWNTEQFWENLCRGVECIRRLDRSESLSAGASGLDVRDPSFVRAKGVMPGYDVFAAEFFDYNAREAEMMDPQLRLLHELAWETLEEACIDPFTYPGNIGLYVGAMEAGEWLRDVRGQAQTHSQWLGAWSLVDRDFLATRVAHRLNLRGPALTVQTACSTSLVAVDTACQALASGRADVALAGGVSFTLEDQAGYPHEEGMVRSPDGHCRAFDQKAAGTVGGNGGGLVALMRLADVDPRRHHVSAMIQGCAVNNDGNRKVGYTAPSVEGQAEVIRRAVRMAGIEPDTIGYIEAHGTGTRLGDPVEIEGLTAVFGSNSRGRVALGSVKSAIGHLDAAAGVAGVIKALLAIREGKIPPTLNVTEPNPVIGFERTPFYVATRLQDWPEGDAPRRAAISSFGIGGTNAHMVLQEAPLSPAHGTESDFIPRHCQLLLVSAKDEEAVAASAESTALWLRRRHEVSLEDAAYTLQTGRHHFPLRWAGVAANRDEAIARLTNPDDLYETVSTIGERERSLVFLFPGQGAQYGGMGRQLYQDEPVFRREMDLCFDILKSLSPVDFTAAWDGPLLRTEEVQPLLFAVEYSLARLLMAWGIRPSAMMGHSIGEYAAACLAGVLDLEAALKLVTVRGKLMQDLPQGSMLAVAAPEERVVSILADSEEVSVAAVNTPGMCVISGKSPEIERLAGRLEAGGIVCRPLHTSHAFHSPMMDPVVAVFAREAADIRFRPPNIPFVSNVTGRWILEEQAMDPGYWARHLREPVRWSDGLETLMNMENPLFIEVGPGRTLSTFALKHPKNNGAYPAVHLVKHPKDPVEADRFFYGQIGKLWLHGLSIDWRAFNAHTIGRSISMPTYPFKRRRYWPESLPGGNVRAFATDGWLHWVDWVETPTPVEHKIDGNSGYRWLILAGPESEKVVERLRDSGDEILVARVNGNFGGDPQEGIKLDPGNPEHFHKLALVCRQRFSGSIHVLHLWNPAAPREGSLLDRLDHEMNVNFYSLVYLVQAFAGVDAAMISKLWVVTAGAHGMDSREAVNPVGALATGPARVIPIEYPSLDTEWIDCGSLAEDWEDLTRELRSNTRDRIVAFRDGRRYVPGFREIESAAFHRPSPLRRGGVYLVTGGLGALGRAVAGYLLQHLEARVVLLNRTAAPERESWRSRLRSPGTSPETRRRIQFLQECDRFPGRVLCLGADVTRPEDVREALDAALERFGPIHGVFHCAGTADGRLLPQVTETWGRRIMDPKVAGLLVLDHLLDRSDLEFMSVFSSINVLSPPPGQTCYASANAFMDAFCRFRNRDPENGAFYMSLDWDAWAEEGMAVSREFGVEPLDYPLFYGRRREGGAQIFESCLHADDCWLLAEHRVGERRLLPGTAYLELALAAAMLSSERSQPPILEGVVFQSPLWVDRGEKVELQTCLELENDGFRFVIRSRRPGESRPVVHATGQVIWRDEYEGTPLLDIAVTGMSPANLRPGGEIFYGERWNNVTEVYLGDHRAMAVLALPKPFTGDLEVYRFHPALLDSATMFAARCMDGARHDLAPFFYRKVIFYRPFPAELVALASWKDDDGSEDSLTLDIELAGPDGERLATVEGFVMKRVSAAGERPPANDGLFIDHPGDLDSLIYRDTPRPAPAEGEIEVEIVATGLNYKEVLLALGILPEPDDDNLSFGLECSGVVSAVGPGVSEFKTGDPVIAYGDSLFGRFRCLPVDQAAHKPENVGFHEAAGIPLAFLTAYYGLVEYGRLKKGERVLIHSATGGVGQAAVAIVRYLGAEIFATAGSEEKRAFLRDSGIEHAMDSRSPAFAREVMAATGGLGVDVILNSLSGEYIDLGLSVLAPYGRFVEIGLRDIVENRSLGMRVFQQGASFMALQVSTGIPGLGEVLRRIARHIEAGEFAPAPIRLFQPGDARDAFRFMAGSRHMGKIVIARQSSPQVVAEPRGLTRQQGVEALLRALSLGGTAAARRLGQMVVTPHRLERFEARIDVGDWLTRGESRNLSPSHSRPNLATAFEPPGTEMEERLAAIFREFLGLERIGVQDNFFELGATSLDMIQVGNRLKTDLELEVPVVKLFDHPTIRSLSGFLQADGDGGPTAEERDAAAQLVKRGKDRLKQRRQTRRG